MTNVPTPWKDNVYAQKGIAEEVEISFLEPFQGNPLRYSDERMAELVEDIRQNGLREPIMILIGQEDRRVQIGEGNHRLFAAKLAGLTKIPARVMRQRNIHFGWSKVCNHMSNVPEYGYFPADAAPSKVFDELHVA